VLIAADNLTTGHASVPGAEAEPSGIEVVSGEPRHKDRDRSLITRARVFVPHARGARRGVENPGSGLLSQGCCRMPLKRQTDAPSWRQASLRAWEPAARIGRRGARRSPFVRNGRTDEEAGVVSHTPKGHLRPPAWKRLETGIAARGGGMRGSSVSPLPLS